MAESYSVWAVVPRVHPGLQATKQHLRETFGGPDVEAHVTVLGGINRPLHEAAAMLQKLARSLAPITYRICGVDHGDTYYQCVFLVVDPTPQVMEANTKAKKAFELEDSRKTAYLPHVSLLYGDLKDDQKRNAKAVAEEKFGGVLIDSEFVVSSLTLWATDTGDKLLTSWKKVAECPLEGSI